MTLETVSQNGPSTPTDVAGPTGMLTTWLAEIHLGAVPAKVQTRAKHLILDGLACALVGAQLPWSRTAVEAVTSFEGAGNQTIIGWGRTAAGPAACLLNGTFIRLRAGRLSSPGAPS
jgi:aconitate decarboxylase